MANKGELGLYYLPVMPSFEGGDKAVNDGMGKLLGKLGDLGKRSGRELGKGLGDGLKSAEVEVKRAATAYEKLRDRAADALDKIGVEERKLAKARDGGKADMIAAAEARLAKARRDAARISREAAASYSDLLDRQKRLGEDASNTGGRLAAMAESLGSVSSMGGPVGAVVAGVTTGVAVLGATAIRVTKELYDLGAQFDEMRDSLQVSTGASGDQLEGLVSTVEKLGTTNTASSFADIGAVVADVTRNLHLSGPALEDVTSRIANLNRITGEAVNVRELGKAFRGFGVDAAEQAGALNSLYEASTKSGMSVNDMLASVTKAGPALRQFGLSFGESAALVNTFEEAGVDTDKTIATLNKAFAFFSKQGIPAQQGLRSVIDEIQRLGNTPEAADLANKVFGSKGGVNFFELIRSGAVDLQSLSASLQSTGLDINETAAQTADWSERWTILKNEGLKALEPLGSAVFDVVNDKLGSLASWVETHQDQIIDFFVGMGEAAITGAEFVVKGLGSAAGAIGDIIAPIGDALGAMDKFQAWQADIRGDSETAAELRKQAEEMFGLGEGLQKFGDTADGIDFAGARAKLRDLGDEAKRSAKSSDGAASSLGSLGESAKPLPGHLDPVNSGLSTLSDNVKTGASNLQTLVEQLNSAGDAMAMFRGADGAPGLALGAPGLFGAGGSGAGGPYAGDAALLARVPKGGRYDASGDLLQGLADCTSGIEDLVNLLDGRPTAGRSMATGNADEWLRSRGFIPTNVPMPGTFQVGFNSHHMEGTLPGGTNVNYGSDASVASGGTAGAGGAWAPGFTSHYYRPFGAGGDGYRPGTTTAPPAVANLGALPPGPVTDLGAPLGPPPGLVLPSTLADTNPGATTDYAASEAAAAAARLIGASPINAFGNGYEPGYGTPGYQDGTPGYFRPDPKQVREAVQRAEAAQARIGESDAAITKAARDADQRATDAHNRMLEADKAVAEALAKVNELDITASEDQRTAAQEEVRRARAVAATARREAQDAQDDGADAIRKARQDAQTARQDARDAAADAEDAKKGSFTAAKKRGKGSGQGDDLSAIGGIFGSFLKETFGLDGSLFPDIGNLGAVKAAGTLAGAFMGQSDPGLADVIDTGASTSSLPFGMIPGVSSLLPPTDAGPAAPAAHSGSGAAPGPIDASTNITINNPQGDEQSIANRTRQTLLRTPRLNTYSAPGVGGR